MFSLCLWWWHVKCHIFQKKATNLPAIEFLLQPNNQLCLWTNILSTHAFCRLDLCSFQLMRFLFLIVTSLISTFSPARSPEVFPLLHSHFTHEPYRCLWWLVWLWYHGQELQPSVMRLWAANSTHGTAVMLTESTARPVDVELRKDGA